MNKSELPETKETDISNLRARVQEIVDSKQGEDSYVERLKKSFDELLFSISRTVGKVEGGDANSAGILEADLNDLRINLDKLKGFLP